MSTRPNKQTYPALFQSGFKYIKESEIEQYFLGVLNSPRRKMLKSHLVLFLNKLKSLGIKGELWIDGSFSTKNPNPMDIDVLLVTSREALLEMTPENRKELDEITSKDNREYVRTKWICDLYVIESSNVGDRKYFEELFSRNPDEENKKGIPIITL